MMSDDSVNHPIYYGGKGAIYETIKVLEAWMPHEHFLGFLRGSAIVYMQRAGKKEGEPAAKDLAKAAFYVEYEQDYLKRHESGHVGEERAIGMGYIQRREKHRLRRMDPHSDDAVGRED